MNFIYILLIIIGIGSMIGIVYISCFNNLQFTKTKIEQSEGIIDEVLRNRFDIIVRTSDVVKNNLEEKKDYLKEYLSLKEEKISNFEMDRKVKEAFNIILNLKNDYPSLQKNNGMKEILSEIKATDEKLSAAISYYNRYTSQLNEYIRKFPSNIIAKIHGFSIKPFFDGKNMNDEDIMDFKL